MKTGQTDTYCMSSLEKQLKNYTFISIIKSDNGKHSLAACEGLSLAINISGKALIVSHTVLSFFLL